MSLPVKELTQTDREMIKSRRRDQRVVPRAVTATRQKVSNETMQGQTFTDPAAEAPGGLGGN